MSSKDEERDEKEENKENREKGMKALGTVIKSADNIKIIEKYIFNQVDSDDYNKAIYQVIGDISSGKSLKSVLENVKKGNICWKHPCFSDITNKIAEKDEFIVRPFEVTEGVTECLKCGSKRTFTFQKQTRSLDEMTSTLCQCMNCKNKWVYSG